MLFFFLGQTVLGLAAVVFWQVEVREMKKVHSQTLKQLEALSEIVIREHDE